jgi:hypothetical protein
LSCRTTASVLALSLVLTACSEVASDANASAKRASPNGFDLSNATIPAAEILSGGPPRDGIPSIDNPRFISAQAADFLRPDDQVLSISIGAETRAYPLRILVWHEIVNDAVGGQPILVTYCPLCGTAMVFNRKFDGRTLTFGVSGLLYQSDVLMYDRQTESLWSQLAMRSVSGAFANTLLEWLASEQMTWSEWQQKFPNGKVLSTQTGHVRDYDQMPYAGYENRSDAIFPVPAYRKELPRKAWVLGVVVNGAAKAYPLAGLPRNETVSDTVGGTEMRITLKGHSGTATVTDSNGQVIPAVRVYWFAWQAFYPETSLWTR